MFLRAFISSVIMIAVGISGAIFTAFRKTVKNDGEITPYDFGFFFFFGFLYVFGGLTAIVSIVLKFFNEID